jgi:hypothetical protein
MPAAALPTIHRTSDARPYTWGEAMREWTPFAEDALRATAQQYHGVIERETLADRVQRDSGVVTSEPAEGWVERLLAHVAKHLAFEGSPPLVSLCVDDAGYVGREYIQLPATVEYDTSIGIEENAAAHRLACYREFALDLPADGGVPGPAPKPKTRARSAAAGGAKRPAKAPGTRPATSATASGSRATSATAAKTAAAAKRRREDPVAEVCTHCFMQLPASGVCDNCG